VDQVHSTDAGLDALIDFLKSQTTILLGE